MSNELPISFNPILDGFEYDGQNFKIKNLTIYEDLEDDWGSSDGSPYGLFAAIQNGKISNTHLVNVNIKSKYNKCGSLVGLIKNSTIENCTVKNVEITALQSTVGGLIGEMYDNCTLKNCHVYDFDFIGKLINPEFDYYGPNMLGGLVGYIAEYYGEGGE